MPRAALLAALLLAVPGCLVPLLPPEATVTHPLALLKSEPYPDLLVEIDYVEGYAPSALALEALRGVLEAVTDKRQIRILEPTPIPAQGGGYDAADIMAIHRATFDHASARPFGHGEAGTLHILYLDGTSRAGDGHSQFQGIYVRQGQDAAAALLPDHWRGRVGPVVLPAHGLFDDRFERAVLIHEVGHAMGLVNHGIPMLKDRERPDDPGHSANPESVMHTGDAPLTDDALVFMMNQGIEPVWRFDEDDLADLRAFREARD